LDPVSFSRFRISHDGREYPGKLSQKPFRPIALETADKTWIKVDREEDIFIYDRMETAKISTNLERIADQSVTIARRAKHLNNRPAVREVALLEPVHRLAVAIFRDSIRTFADSDCELARTLKLKDRELDAITREVSEKLVARATVDSGLVPSYVDLILVARALERIGDHATNIAEDSFWRDQAADIRHTYPKKEF